ncbi:g1499 [Coccomyxa elongata]
MSDHVCFQKEDGTALTVPLTPAGTVDLKKVAGLFHGSTERPLALQMHLCTWSLVSLKNDNCKLTLALLRASTGREGTSNDPFIVRFMDGPAEQIGAMQSQGDISAERAARLAQPPLARPPNLDRVEEFLFGRSANLPISADALSQLRVLDPSIAACFTVDDGSARQLASLLSHSVTWQPAPGGEAAASEAVNQILINVLQGIDRLAGAQASMRLEVCIDCDSQAGQVRACAGGLPKGRLVGGPGQKLLALWEERSSECSLQDAAADLAAKAPSHVPEGLPYLLCFAVAGLQLQFYAVPSPMRGGGNPPGLVPLGRAFELGRAADRAWVVAAAVSMYRLLSCFGRAQDSPRTPLERLAQAMSSL